MVAANLMLSSDSRVVSYDDLDGMPMPDATQTHVPIPHMAVVDAARKWIGAIGLTVTGEKFAVAPGLGKMGDGRFFGVMDLSSTIVEGVTTVLGLRNSHDKSMTAGVCAGERVFVCDNLAFSAEVVVLRMHTRHIMRDLESRMEEGLGNLHGFEQVRARRIVRMQDTPIHEEQTHDLAIRALDAGVIGLRELPKLLEEFRSPINDQRFGEWNLWNTYNCFTEIKKERFAKGASAAQSASKETIRLNRLFAEQFPVLVN